MPREISCIVVEDEPRSLHLMENLLKEIPGIRLMATFPHPEEAFAYAVKNEPDLLFLDIRMPGMDGLQFVEKLEKEHHPIPFIFVTAYNEFLMEALRKSAVDYLLKPISQEQLREAVDRYREKSELKAREAARESMDSLTSELLRFDFMDGFEIVARSEILCLEADQSYTRVQLTNGKELAVSRNLGQFDYLTGGGDFIRVHRSTIINTKYFRKLSRLQRNCTLVAEGQEYKTKVSKEGIKILDRLFPSHES